MSTSPYDGVRRFTTSNSSSRELGRRVADLRPPDRRAKLENAVYSDPSRVVDLLANYYLTQGYYARWESPKLDLNPSTAPDVSRSRSRRGPGSGIGQVVFQETPSPTIPSDEPRLSAPDHFHREGGYGALERIDRFYHSRGITTHLRLPKPCSTTARSCRSEIPDRGATTERDPEHRGASNERTRPRRAQQCSHLGRGRFSIPSDAVPAGRSTIRGVHLVDFTRNSRSVFTAGKRNG